MNELELSPEILEMAAAAGLTEDLLREQLSGNDIPRELLAKFEAVSERTVKAVAEKD
ncbi:hypothetical protein [Maridesulfovibrio sp. FT414]|uniref:hypothetical protein n=1 Tax=Maridesulfovibrio sp. FT414 TaxID=2979469 RepID=UPI003D8078B4